MQPAWRKLFIQKDQPSKLLPPAALAAGMNDILFISEAPTDH